MKVKDLKWYSPFLFLLGAILSFADPITDILTLVEFYRTDHKTWFGVGLVFVILPSYLFLLSYCMIHRIRIYLLDVWSCARSTICGFHPFSAALARLEGFIFCLKKWWRGEQINSPDSTEEAEVVLRHIDLVVLVEAVFESAPQFILQLYAISVQEEPVTIIQIISLPVSFLSLAWAFTSSDEWALDRRGMISSNDLTVKHRIVLYVTHLLILSSRLFAIGYFTISYKWWVSGVLLFHCCAVVAAVAIIQYRHDGELNARLLLYTASITGYFCLRDDTVHLLFHYQLKSLSIALLSKVLFLSENLFMILMFYFSPHSNTWYSLPVTVCVCVFSVLGSIMRIIVLLGIRRENVDMPIQRENSAYPSAPQAENNNSAADIIVMPWVSTV